MSLNVAVFMSLGVGLGDMAKIFHPDIDHFIS